MLKYIFIALFLVATWGVVVYFELPYGIAISITLVTAAVIGIVFAVRYVRSRRASREIEKALKAQAEEQARSARPDLEADIRSMQEEFTRAINALKSSRLGARGASSALYSLPWYVIVGPPGVGKSTALRNSGLKFPFSSNRGGVSVQGVGGTRNCEWWMTSEAVVLDTAGRYTTEGSDRDEWFAFLDLLRKYRSRRPINGVLAAVSVADIAEAHPEEIAGLAREIRARIDELQGRLGVVVPVYLLFTKFDLLPGFVEMFSDLSEAERHQIWGFTLKVSDQLALSDQCAQHLDTLSSLLEKRALRRMAEERSMARREKIHEHPQYFAALREPIARFVHELTEPNIYHETPILRGVYMTSGTQEGRPLNRIMSSISEAFGLRLSGGGMTAPPVDAKSYFLGEIFRKVIFPDYGLVRHNRLRTRNSRVFGTVAGVLALVTAAGTVWFPLSSYRYNRELLGQAGTAFAYIEQHIEQDTVDVISMDRIEPLRRMVETLDDYADEGPPWSLQMGMYQGERAYPRVRDVFADTVRRELLIPVAQHELEALAGFVRRYALNHDTPTLEEYTANFARLRTYLLTTAPAPEFEPGLGDEAEFKWLTDRLTTLWQGPLAVSGAPATRSRIEAVATTYVQMLAARQDLAFERDEATVKAAREILVRCDRTEALTNAVIASVTGPAITLRALLGVSTIQNDERQIRPAFTKKGFLTQVEPLLDGELERFLDPPWVLGRPTAADDELHKRELTEIRSAYFKRYIAEWRAFLDAIYVNTPRQTDSIDTLGMLTELTRSEPYKALFQNVAWHTTLFDPRELEKGTAGGDDGMSRLKGELGEAAGFAAADAGSRFLPGGGMVGTLDVGYMLAEAGASALEAARAAADPNSATVLSKYTVHAHFEPFVRFGAPVRAPAPKDGSPAPPAPVTPLDQYTEQLLHVRNALEARLDDPNDKQKLVEKLKSARSKVKSLLASESKNSWSPTLEKMLLPPLELASKGVSGDIAKDRQNKWCKDVVATFDRTLARRYPFNPKGDDVSLADFAAFFRPGEGKLWKYYETALASAAVKRGNRFELVDTGSAGSPYRTNLLDFLNASHELSEAMFAGGAEMPVVEFEISIAGSSELKEIKFTVDGASARYRNGPQRKYELKWPGEGTKGAKLEIRGLTARDELQFPGTWGLVRLLEHGKVRRSRPGQRIFVAQWDFTDENLGLVQITFETKRADTPFHGLGGRKPFLSVFRTSKVQAPRSIMKNAPPCETAVRR